jgi:hypothetical protein
MPKHTGYKNMEVKQDGQVTIRRGYIELNRNTRHDAQKTVAVRKGDTISLSPDADIEADAGTL